MKLPKPPLVSTLDPNGARTPTFFPKSGFFRSSSFIGLLRPRRGGQTDDVPNLTTRGDRKSTCLNRRLSRGGRRCKLLGDATYPIEQAPIWSVDMLFLKNLEHQSFDS